MTLTPEGVNFLRGIAGMRRRWDTLTWTGGGGAYNPGAYVTVAGTPAAVVRNERTFPCTVASMPPLFVDLDDRGQPCSTYLTGLDGWTTDRIEDFRPLQYGTTTFVVHTVVPPYAGSPGVRPGGIQPKLSILDGTTLTRHDELKLPRLLAPVEKNWVLFQSALGLGLVYSLDPLIIYVRSVPKLSGRWSLVQHQPTGWTHALGKPPRNSANLVPFDDGWLGWWHTVLDRSYVTGAYWLDAQLRLTARSGVIFDGADVVDGHKPGVLYLSSQVWETPAQQTRLRVYFGEADTWCSTATISADEIRRRLQ